ncbi:glycosyltransferase [Rhodoblastus acidophilus]|uniref:Glycosyltransferase n=1 Tax=Candidatus Rhodoblastus alkanivorans TaxID=2954117 RepID=A0ABS9Z7P1_9HYPH|nr:glycosyltransferase [Candidatus Rhodoblastus alkanivorans]MCI4678364.1 glycosyltransferase [Candidatus Rhodoblastus alkanivorans]MCI4683622.1 glycosyltransferase [Candidatus Rhodoblastus alkanivorans]MDI4640938.1 glycosyltransferase [Rhodoblastus acidophilus]
MLKLAAVDEAWPSAIDVSIVMPCLDEALSLPHCIANAREALAQMRDGLGLSGEIVISDNGSEDGSQMVARALGATVTHCPRRGYGAAVIHGMRSANGRFLVMGDADGSYDFRDAVAMVERLAQGADLCMGSRFKAGIAPGAMPWKNRYIGNPVLTGVLNLFFHAGVSDAHCGLRALTRDCFERLDLRGSGMEFASEMVVKAALKGEKIAEAPAKLLPDLRDRPPHLRPWRDGWRHLRYLFMLSPVWAFAVPALLAAAMSLTIWAAAGLAFARGRWEESAFGNYWVVLAGALLGLSHIAALFAASAHIYGRRAGFRRATGHADRIAKWTNLETMLIGGGVVAAAGLAILTLVFGYWSQHHFQAIGSVLPAVVGTTLIVIGAQNALGGILLAVVNGHETEFVKAPRESAPVAAPQPAQPESQSRVA